EQAGLQHLAARRAQTMVGTARGSPLAGPVRAGRAERARGRAVEVARRRRKEHEADEVGPRLKGDLEGFRRLQAADFDESGHRSARSTSPISLSSSARRGAIRFSMTSAMISRSICQYA